MFESYEKAIADIAAGLSKFRIIHLLSIQEVSHRYRRSSLGVFWITGNMAVLIATIGFVFGNIFIADTSKYVPFLTAGFIFWGLFSTTLGEGVLAYINGEELLKSEPIPMSLLIFRALWYNLIVAAHNFVIFIFVSVIFDVRPNIFTLFLVPGLCVFVATTFFLVLLFAPIATRFRDMAPIISNILQVAFYLTPVVWLPSLLSSKAVWLFWNPFFHLLEIVRRPLLGEAISAVSWAVSLGVLVVAGLLALFFHGKFRDRITYWL